MEWTSIFNRIMNPFFRAPRPATADGTEGLPTSTRGSTKAGTENKKLSKFVAEIEADYQFKFAKECLQALVTTNKVRFAAANKGDTLNAALAENAQTFWDQTVRQAFDAFGYGRAAFEKAYGSDETGAIILTSLDYLPFDDSEMDLGPDGEFLGIKICGKETLPPDACWWFALDPTPKEPHGRSRYVGAPARVNGWRRRLDDNEDKWYSRFAIGHGVGRFPEPTGAESRETKNHPRSALSAELARIESGGTLLLSSQQYMAADGSPSGQFLYDWQPSEGLRDATALVTRRQSLDVCVLRSLSIPEMALTNPGNTGTFAMAEVHQLLLDATADELLGQMVKSYVRYVVDKLLAINGRSKGDVVAQWEPLVDKRRAAIEKSSQQQAAQQQQQRSPFGSFAIGSPAKLPTAVESDSQVADRGLSQIDHDGMSADLIEFLSDRSAVQSAMQHVVGEPRRRL